MITVLPGAVRNCNNFLKSADTGVYTCYIEYMEATQKKGENKMAQIEPITETLNPSLPAHQVKELVELQLVLDYGFAEDIAGKIAEATAQRWVAGGPEITTNMIKASLNGPQQFASYAKQTAPLAYAI